jgi:C-terminal processing protease CtpA/Prc
MWAPLSSGREQVETLGKGQVKARPERIWVMTDAGCASSCEQFVSMVKQNRRVTLVGRPTMGALDASNLRPFRTPSGTIAVYFATTHVRRPPGQEVDEVGIAPSIALPLTADEAGFAAEVSTVQAMAERATN